MFRLSKKDKGISPPPPLLQASRRTTLPGSHANNPGAASAATAFVAAQAKWRVIDKTVGLGQQDILAIINSNAALANANNKSSSSENNTSFLTGMDIAYFPRYSGNDSPSWRELRLRVLPLFNGEGLKGSIEELNDAAV
ncbi:hypothetical protein BC830DRAFT_1163519 [Chytriomyces sp. MP71]|nr:hypothetical protein BC830DRAFT_1163519 [Chytriomyces sp. MP71]